MIGKRDKVLRRFRKTDSVEAEVTSGGRLFQRRHSATGNARSPTVDTCISLRVCIADVSVTNVNTSSQSVEDGACRLLRLDSSVDMKLGDLGGTV